MYMYVDKEGRAPACEVFWSSRPLHWAAPLRLLLLHRGLNGMLNRQTRIDSRHRAAQQLKKSSNDVPCPFSLTGLVPDGPLRTSTACLGCSGWGDDRASRIRGVGAMSSSAHARFSYAKSDHLLHSARALLARCLLLRCRRQAVQHSASRAVTPRAGNEILLQRNFYYLPTRLRSQSLGAVSMAWPVSLAVTMWSTEDLKADKTPIIPSYWVFPCGYYFPLSSPQVTPVLYINALKVQSAFQYLKTHGEEANFIYYIHQYISTRMYVGNGGAALPYITPE
ncbi:hypothetical protein F5B20DRAFT_304591 [Whalleya microplaca]|nr:hypothetical protein F5B20DRAFT_304591 [Whalleya microplaca]